MFVIVNGVILEPLKGVDLELSGLDLRDVETAPDRLSQPALPFPPYASGNTPIGVLKLVRSKWAGITDF